MIISIEKLRALVPSAKDIDDDTLQAQLEGLESFIRAYTNNNFQKCNFRTTADIAGGELVFNCPQIKTGDTIQISKSLYNDGIYTYAASGMELFDEENVLITKVVYPPDIVSGVVNLYKWDAEKRDKTGISSETLSRYSVSYRSVEGANSTAGYPSSLMGFLKPYMKAQF